MVRGASLRRGMAETLRLRPATRLALLLAVLAVGAQPAAATTTPQNDAPLILRWDGSAWTQELLPGPLLGNLSGVAATSGRDAWAVGAYSSGQGSYQPLVEHWDGTRWTQVSSPTINSAQQGSRLTSVAALSARDAWAVGAFAPSQGRPLFRTLVERWNGSAWAVVPSPALGDVAYLGALAAVSPRDVWAVGGTISHGGLHGDYRPLIEHWNGSSWLQTRLPYLARGITWAQLDDVAALSARDVWAVGQQISRISGRSSRALVLHWNGSRWREVAGPAPRHSSYVVLDCVAGYASGTPWTAGTRFPAGPGPYRPLIARRSRGGWSSVRTPSRRASSLVIDALTVLSPRNGWAVGVLSPLPGPEQTLVEHWDGNTWKIIPSPSPGPTHSILMDVAAVRPSLAWAVGYSG
jgi:hypothetical protein